MIPQHMQGVSYSASHASKFTGGPSTATFLSEDRRNMGQNHFRGRKASGKPPISRKRIQKRHMRRPEKKYSSEEDAMPIENDYFYH